MTASPPKSAPEGNPERLRAIPEASVVVPVRCGNDECGMVSPYRFYRDGSFRKILDACWHAKRLPSREKVLQTMKEEGIPCP